MFIMILKHEKEIECRGEEGSSVPQGIQVDIGHLNLAILLEVDDLNN